VVGCCYINSGYRKYKKFIITKIVFLITERAMPGEHEFCLVVKLPEENDNNSQMSGYRSDDDS